jgi:hypothetical protein
MTQEKTMYRYLTPNCSLFFCCGISKEKQPLLQPNKNKENILLTAQEIKNIIINIFNYSLATEIAGIFKSSVVSSDPITMREKQLDIKRMNVELTHGRTMSSNRAHDVGEQYEMMYRALGQKCDSNVQLCISNKLHAELPENIIIQLKIDKTERAEEEAVVNLIIENAAIIKDNAKTNEIPLNLLCKIAIKKDSILLQLIDVTTQVILVSIPEDIPNSRRDTFSCDSRSSRIALFT